MQSTQFFSLLQQFHFDGESQNKRTQCLWFYLLVCTKCETQLFHRILILVTILHFIIPIHFLNAIIISFSLSVTHYRFDMLHIYTQANCHIKHLDSVVHLNLGMIITYVQQNDVMLYQGKNYKIKELQVLGYRLSRFAFRLSF